MSNLEIHLLGPVELRSGVRQISLGTPKQQCLFTMLVLNPGRPLSVDILIDRLWGDNPPGEARKSLYTYVARLRRTLASGGALEIISLAATYALRVDPLCIDVHQARALIDEATAAVSAGRDQAAVPIYRRALSLWQGNPLSGLRGDWAERTRAGLRHELLAALTECFAAELRLGRHMEVIGELSTAVSDHHLDEALACQLMLGLYRSHRPADAVAVFHRTKAGLADQLGLDPGPRLRQLYAAVLRNDPLLELRTVR